MQDHENFQQDRFGALSCPLSSSKNEKLPKTGEFYINKYNSMHLHTLIKFQKQIHKKFKADV
jgi:hypothetical protein